MWRRILYDTRISPHYLVCYVQELQKRPSFPTRTLFNNRKAPSYSAWGSYSIWSIKILYAKRVTFLSDKALSFPAAQRARTPCVLVPNNNFPDLANFDFIAGTILGSTKDPHRFQGQQSYSWLRCTMRKADRVPRWQASGANIPELASSSKHHSCPIWTGRTMPTKRVQASLRKKHECKAAATQVQTPPGRSSTAVCLHAEHSSAAAAAAAAAETEAPRGTQKKGGKPSNTPVNHWFCKLINFWCVSELFGLEMVPCPVSLIVPSCKKFNWTFRTGSDSEPVLNCSDCGS